MSQAQRLANLAALTTTTTLPLIADIAVRFAVLATHWHLRSKTRKQLSKLDAHLLCDVGIEPEAAHEEASKPFWRS
ncbi:MAG: DUF1127 domain-containing protein [Pseudomonadota bacterium]